MTSFDLRLFMEGAGSLGLVSGIIQKWSKDAIFGNLNHHFLKKLTW